MTSGRRARLFGLAAVPLVGSLLVPVTGAVAATPSADGARAALAATAPAAAAPAGTSRTTVATTSPTTRASLDHAIRSWLRGRRSTVGIGVYDARTGTTYLYNNGLAFYTASIVKVQVLAALLHRADVHHRPLTAWEKSKAQLMIEQSDNDATTALWKSLGGGRTVAANNRAMGLTGTVMNAGGAWGLTTTKPLDQLTLVRNIAYSSKVLTPTDRAYARYLMGHVTSWQRWGVSSGVTHASVQLKNGWLPLATHGWHVNSIGHVSGNGRDYVIAVLSVDNATMDYGVETVSGVSRIVWSALAHPLQ